MLLYALWLRLQLLRLLPLLWWLLLPLLLVRLALLCHIAAALPLLLLLLLLARLRLQAFAGPAHAAAALRRGLGAEHAPGQFGVARPRLQTALLPLLLLWLLMLMLLLLRLASSRCPSCNLGWSACWLLLLPLVMWCQWHWLPWRWWPQGCCMLLLNARRWLGVLLVL
jgi:hypothetical protein